MPARIGPLRAAALQQRLVNPLPPPLLLQRQHHRLFFHSTPIRRDEIDDKNHYETLNIQTNASSADIKKSFYTLSKTHHPDHNRSDPNASRRFMRISEAYSTLSNVDKRAKYDRDILRLHDQKDHHRHHHPHSRAGSFSSTGPAGGRPASGLSRRRGTFRGPPPSFYRSGGWGAHGTKRSAAHEGSTGGASSSSTSGAKQEGNSSSSSYGAESGGGGNGYTSYNGGGGMGPGQEPFGRGSARWEMPHFDRTAQTSHTRTQARNEARRARRVAREYDFPGSSEDLGDFGKVFAILGVLGLGGLVPYLFLRGTGAIEGKKTKAN